MVILKLITWCDRPEERDNDLYDILRIIEYYFEFNYDEILEHHNDTVPEDRLVTKQDKGLYSLCEPKRLLELVYKYIVFDDPDKKIDFIANKAFISKIIVSSILIIILSICYYFGWL